MLRENVKKTVIEKILRKHYADPRLGHRKFGVLVLDKTSVEVVNACLTIGEVFEEGVTLVEDISKNREPLQSLSAIYLLAPTDESIEALIADFTQKTKLGPKTMYSHAFVYFLDPVTDEQMNRIAKSGAQKYIQALWEMNLSFTPIEEHVFTVGSSDICQTAAGIVSVCSALNVWPSLSAEICYRVEDKLAELQKHQTELVVDSDAQLIILDRSFDLISPLLHECSFQAMAADLTNYSKKGIYTFTADNGQAREVLLDETDQNWVNLRHKHLGEVMQKVSTLTRQTLRGAGTFEGNESIKELSAKIRQMPAMQKQTGRLTAYINLADECRQKYFNELQNVVLLEQDMATGYTQEGALLKDTQAVSRLSTLILPAVPLETRLRLILIFMLTIGKDKDEQYFGRLLHHTDIPENEKEMVMKMLKWRQQSTIVHPRPLAVGERFSSSRWDPRIREVLLQATGRKLNEKEFLVIGRPPVATNGQRTASSARYGRALAGMPIEKRKIIIFIVGGMTYSEIRTAYEISRETNTSVIIGSDSILTPSDFLETLRNFSK